MICRTVGILTALFSAFGFTPYKSLNRRFLIKQREENLSFSRLCMKLGVDDVVGTSFDLARFLYSDEQGLINYVSKLVI
jgi:hypothetical protein